MEFKCSGIFLLGFGFFGISQAANLLAPQLAGVFLGLVGYQTLLPFAKISFVLALLAIQFVRRGDVVKNVGNAYEYIPDVG